MAKVIFCAVLLILAVSAFWYLVFRGDSVMEYKPACSDMATGSAVSTLRKKLSRIFSKNPVIAVYEYIYTRFFKRNH